MEKTSQEIFALLNSTIIDRPGNIVFTLANTSVRINTTDIVGSSIQSWLKQWLDDNNIYYSEPHNTQEFPDFYLSKHNQEEHMLEVKAFHYNATPAFDIANYESYLASVVLKPYRLHADYLIFGYTMDTDGIISIKNIWLKKIWEIAGTSTRYALNTQIKRGVIYNIRPNSKFKKDLQVPFATKEDFLSAVYETQKAYRGEENAKIWKVNLKNAYLNYYHTPLIF